MDRVDGGADWRLFFKFFAALALIAAVLKFGTEAYFLNKDLQKSECVAAYWKGRTQGQPKNFCPPSCRCEGLDE